MSNVAESSSGLADWLADWRTGKWAQADWRTGGPADWRTGGLADFGPPADWSGGLADWRTGSPTGGPGRYIWGSFDFINTGGLVADWRTGGLADRSSRKVASQPLCSSPAGESRISLLFRVGRSRFLAFWLQDHDCQCSFQASPLWSELTTFCLFTTWASPGRVTTVVCHMG